MDTPDPKSSMRHVSTDILFSIAEYLDVGGLNNLHQTCRSLYTFLTPLLRKSLALYKNEVLIWAVIHNREAPFHLALEAGADVSHEGSTMKAPLHHAAEGGCNEMVTALLDRGADIEQVCYSVVRSRYPLGGAAGKPLGLALVNGHETTAHLLIGRGADARFKDFGDYSYLHLAAISGLDGFIDTLVEKGVDINGQTRAYSMTALHIAAREGHIDFARRLLEAGIDINYKTSSGTTALGEAAVSCRDMSLAKLLVEKGSCVNHLNNGHRSPLFLAVINKNVDVAQFLLDSGAELDLWDRQKHNVLWHAVRTSNETLVKAILQKGPSINASCDGSKPLLHMALSRTSSLLKILLENGLSIHNYAAPSALHLALRVSPQPTEVEPMCRLLLERGASVGTHDSKGITPLHLAVVRRKNSLPLTRLLVEYGADIRAPDAAGVTPLMLAEQAGEGEIVRALHGEKVDTDFA